MRDDKNNSGSNHTHVKLIKKIVLSMLSVITTAYLITISTCAKPKPNPYPGYCTEFTEFPMSGSSYGSGSFADDGKLLAFIFYGDLDSNIPGADTMEIYYDVINLFGEA